MSRGKGSGGGAGRARFVVECGKVRREREKAAADALAEGLPAPLFGETVKEEARRRCLEAVSRDASADTMKARAALRYAEKTGQSVNVETVNLIHSSRSRPTMARLDLDDERFAKLLEGYDAPDAAKAYLMRERARATLARARADVKLLEKLKRKNPPRYAIEEAKRRGLVS